MLAIWKETNLPKNNIFHLWSKVLFGIGTEERESTVLVSAYALCIAGADHVIIFM